MISLQQSIQKLPTEAQARIAEKSAELMLETGLALLREDLTLSQKQLADAMGVSQPAVAQIEQRGIDVRLSTLKRYIETMGGKLSLAVELPTGQSRIFHI